MIRDRRGGRGHKSSAGGKLPDEQPMPESSHQDSDVKKLVGVDNPGNEIEPLAEFHQAADRIGHAADQERLDEAEAMLACEQITAKRPNQPMAR